MGILRDIARRLLGEEKARSIWDRVEMIGDIAVIKSPRLAGLEDPLSIDDYRLIAEELMRVHKHIRSVWLAVTPTSGEYRVRERYVHLAGERRSETVYREHGCLFKVDIAKVFVTPRLSYEHIRVASLVNEGEEVINMFAGVGTFSIIIACKSKVRKVHSIDINPDAWRYMVENIRLNKVEDKVIAYLGDSADVIEEKLKGVATRVLMPLPELALRYLKYAVKALRGRGVIHVYLHVKALRGEDPLLKAITNVKEELDKIGARLVDAKSRIVRLVGPRLYQVVVDATIEK